MRRFKFIKSNKGSSLILVAALTVVIIGVTVSLRIMAGIIMASANQQLNMDQAYELATSLGNALEERILNGEEQEMPEQGTEQEGAGAPKNSLLDLKEMLGENTKKTITEASGFDGLPGASVKAELMRDESGRFVVKVSSKVGEATYIWTGVYEQVIEDGSYSKCPQ